MNWYNKIILAQNLQTLMNDLKLSPDVANFIAIAPSQLKPKYINEIRKNPSISLQELQTISQEQQIKPIDPYLPHERNLVQNIPEGSVIKWVLVNLRKLRNGKINNYDSIPSYVEFFNLVHNWILDNSLNDFIDNNPNFRIESYTPSQVAQFIEEWHEVSAGKGEGKVYGPVDKNLILYGPTWKNKEFNGHTIQEIKTQNDLEVEGNKMNHCVGDYYTHVKNNKLKIISLRDSTNNPHVTIETDPSIVQFKQIMGNSNKNPSAVYQAMIKEWTISTGKRMYHEDSTNPIRDASYHEDLKDIGEKLDNIRGESDEYGLYRDIDLGTNDFEYLINLGKKESRNYRDGDYYGTITDIPSSFINAMIELYGFNIVNKIEKDLWDYEEKNNIEYDNFDFSYGENPPDQQNFEDENDFNKAYAQWEQQENDYQDEIIREYRGKNLPWGFVDDSLQYINKLREKRKTKSNVKK